MAKTKISEYDSTAANNTDVDGVNLAEGCPPSGINNAIREVMAHLKDWQGGTSGDGFTSSGTITSSGTLAITGNLTLDGASGTSGQVIVSAGSGNTPTWGNAFVAGMIMMWSGSIASIPTGWALCDGTSGTPNLQDRFVIGAGSSYAVAATGGSKDAIVVSHSHTVSGSTTTAGDHVHSILLSGLNTAEPRAAARITAGNDGYDQAGAAGNYLSTAGNHTHSISGTTNTQGSSATNANLPPYYALAYIMKL